MRVLIQQNSQKECSFSVQSVKNHGTKITYTSQFVLTSCPRHFVLMFCGAASLALFLACFFRGFFAKIKAFVLTKLFL